jgi:hypothetical protein
MGGTKAASRAADGLVAQVMVDAVPRFLPHLDADADSEGHGMDRAAAVSRSGEPAERLERYGWATTCRRPVRPGDQSGIAA